MSGVLLRVLCSRSKGAHVVGTVVRDDDGLVLRYKDAMRVDATGRDDKDFEQLDNEYRAQAGVSVGFDAYCASCRQRYFVPAEQIFVSARRGVATFRLQGRNAEARLPKK